MLVSQLVCYDEKYYVYMTMCISTILIFLVAFDYNFDLIV